MANPAPLAPPVAPLDSGDTLSLAERAYRHLRDAIVRGTLEPGTRVSERSLALALGISAQPVREALRRLESDGMVVTLPRRGTVVAEFGPDLVGEMGHIRVALEGVAAALAAPRVTDADLEVLGGHIRAMRAATAAHDLEELAVANEAFHATIRELTGNVFLIRALAALRAYNTFGRIRALSSTPSEPDRALREHTALLAALRRRDPVLAEKRMRAHVQRSIRVAGADQLKEPPGMPPARRGRLTGRG
jgi:DNA-binding GntR family transcriptional regulator